MHCIAMIAERKSREPVPAGFAWGGGFQCSCGKQYRFYVPGELPSNQIESYRNKARHSLRHRHPTHPDEFEIPVP